ncbi:MAG TPA: hypothetical protein VNR38_23520 [Ureibacillus sp.]|nr:hypothetical protein [Ureibacillus sp.]
MNIAISMLKVQSQFIKPHWVSSKEKDTYAIVATTQTSRNLSNLIVRGVRRSVFIVGIVSTWGG